MASLLDESFLVFVLVFLQLCVNFFDGGSVAILADLGLVRDFLDLGVGTFLLRVDLPLEEPIQEHDLLIQFVPFRLLEVGPLDDGLEAVLDLSGNICAKVLGRDHLLHRQERWRQLPFQLES